MHKFQASALGFQAPRDYAPRVLASGREDFARQIVKTAEEEGIPVVVNRDLSALLMDVKPGSEIPENLYRAVSTLLAMVYRLNGGNVGTEK